MPKYLMGKQIYPQNAFWLALSVFAIILDQWTKWLAESYLIFHEPVPVMPMLNWTLAYNKGAAFSFLANAGGWQQYFFMALAGVMSVIFAIWLMRLSPKLRVMPMALALILGGAVGNLIDRITLGHVIDFIHVYWNNSHFPIFNIADCAITLGAILLLVDSFFLEKKRENHQ